MALHGRLISLRQDENTLHYRAIWPTISGSLATPPRLSPTSGVEEDDDTLELLEHYLNLKPNLVELYEQWATADANFKKKAPKFTGVRILKQDAWEALIGFICSSNNNIARISQMVHKLCTHYGPLIAHLDGVAYHDFPSPGVLTSAKVEQHLRELGFGYRAKYLHKTANMIEERGMTWLDGLRNPESPLLGEEPSSAGEMRPEGREGYRHAHERLLELQGVGPKVADCVCLFGLGWVEVVPVDTHVWQIAQRDYRFGKGKHSSLTKATYDAVANKFRALWGKEAGWAHSVLFTADLRVFSGRLVEKVEKVEIKTIKMEDENVPMVETIKKETRVTKKRIKAEPEPEDSKLFDTSRRSDRTTKRRRNI